MCARALNLWVFRESRNLRGAAQTRAELIQQLERCFPDRSRESCMSALLRAGEIECGVADDGSVTVAPWRELTDSLAGELVSSRCILNSNALIENARRARLPESIAISPAEGFAYYALHPLAYADVLEAVPLNASVAVVGIRSIGATLSAVVAAAARARGKAVERMTVRPGGHPYNRSTTFSSEQIGFVHRHAACGSTFLVVDEGPGLSGSSFLSVAEALEHAGVPISRISLLCSHAPDFDDLRAEGAAHRARRFRWIPVPSDARRPRAADEFIGGGEWRKKIFTDPEQWPASWIRYERLKYLSPADTRPQQLFKFNGLGHYGDAVMAREEKLAGAGFAPEVSRESDGFVSYHWIAGRPMSREDLAKDSIKRLAGYCSFRALAFFADTSDIETLQRMAEHNLQQLNMTMPLRLSVQRPVIADGCMRPHEWLLTADGQMLKTDGGAHGDDHFFPGPTDIAWDLAGAIVEWEMNPGQSSYFLDCYRSASGDDSSGRIEDFLAAYAAFRGAWCRMAANALSGSPEEIRMQAAARRYESVLSRLSKPRLVSK